MSKEDQVIQEKWETFFNSHKVFQRKKIPVKKDIWGMTYYTYYVPEKDEEGHELEKDGYIYYKPIFRRYAKMIMFKGKWNKGGLDTRNRNAAELQMAMHLLKDLLLLAGVLGMGYLWFSR